MLSVSDILKILDQIPIWKSLSALPRRVTELEQRLTALEAAAAKPAAAPGQPCPACGARALRRTKAERSTGPFGTLGARDEVRTCGECGGEDHRANVR